MKNKRLASIVLTCVAVAASAVVLAGSGMPVMKTPDKLKWMPNPGAPEVQTAAAWGDMNKGPHGAFHKFPAGYSVPLHTHPSNHKVVVISGTMIMAGADGKETKFPPGSYYTQPAGYKHTTKCMEGSECLIYVTADGKFAVDMVGKK